MELQEGGNGWQQRVCYHLGGTCFAALVDGDLEICWNCERKKNGGPGAEGAGTVSPASRIFVVVLTAREWKRLMLELKPEIDKHLGPCNPCYMDESHFNQMGMLECPECNPFNDYYDEYD